ncbi:hypothetical protein [Nonomuraea angiospora]|uniref:hypothetical protein n=1 Tax=Nonomuraea angiospora TaxID=46172 RepID=UPI0029BEE2E8|nr:hypothetical protein [Nonomuraea angiospora]MDX3102582.1 hypothetical protein [Nonomuraea angiospora]
MNAFAHPEVLAKAYMEMSGQVAAGELRVVRGGDHPMSEVRRVHADLRGHRTVGTLVLDPTR